MIGGENIPQGSFLPSLWLYCLLNSNAEGGSFSFLHLAAGVLWGGRHDEGRMEALLGCLPSFLWEVPFVSKLWRQKKKGRNVWGIWADCQSWQLDWHDTSECPKRRNRQAIETGPQSYKAPLCAWPQLASTTPASTALGWQSEPSCLWISVASDSFSVSWAPEVEFETVCVVKFSLTQEMSRDPFKFTDLFSCVPRLSVCYEQWWFRKLQAVGSVHPRLLDQGGEASDQDHCSKMCSVCCEYSVVWANLLICWDFTTSCHETERSKETGETGPRACEKRSKNLKFLCSLLTHPGSHILLPDLICWRWRGVLGYSKAPEAPFLGDPVERTQSRPSSLAPPWPLLWVSCWGCQRLRQPSPTWSGWWAP